MMNRQKMYSWMAKFTGAERVPQTSQEIMDIFRSNVYTSDGDVELLLVQASAERKKLRHDTLVRIARTTGRIVVAGTHVVSDVISETKQTVASAGYKVLDFIERATLPLTEWCDAEDMPPREIVNRSTTEE